MTFMIAWAAVILVCADLALLWKASVRLLNAEQPIEMRRLDLQIVVFLAAHVVVLSVYWIRR